jgi:hypothetical protein
VLVRAWYAPAWINGLRGTYGLVKPVLEPVSARPGELVLSAS